MFFLGEKLDMRRLDLVRSCEATPPPGSAAGDDWGDDAYLTAGDEGDAQSSASR